ncbi:MAG: hypothetical protein ACOYOB_20085 [Myxococcota bacterium]
MTQVCPLCGSDKVFAAVWQDLNTGDVQSSDCMPDMREHYWCDGCRRHPDFVTEITVDAVQEPQ